MRITKNDPDAASRVEDLIIELMDDHARMKAANAHCRKHGTMRGFEDISGGEAEKWDAERKLKSSGMPYPPNIVTNSGARIRRLKTKLAFLEQGGHA